MEAAPIAMLALLGMIYQRIGVTLLSTIAGAVATGVYSAASRAVEASKTLHFAVFTVLYPVMIRSRSGRIPAHSMTLDPSIAADGKKFLGDREVFIILMAGTILISTMLFVFSIPIVQLLYGQEFIISARVLQILAWTLIPFVVNSYLTLHFLAVKRERTVLYILSICVLVLFVLNLLWIPIHGPLGSAWAALASESLQSALLVACATPFLFVKGETGELSKFP
jgi:O-antigen/teichoic acid export membrane protein